MLLEPYAPVKSDEYAKLLGQVIANLQSLEFLLRVYLHKRGDTSGPPSGLDSLKVGARVPVNALTDYRTLRQLIEASGLRVDTSVITLRDALAHGRVSADSPSAAFKILKFKKPPEGSKETTVDYAETLSAKWLKGQKMLVRAQIDTVRKALERIEP